MFSFLKPEQPPLGGAWPPETEQEHILRQAEGSRMLDYGLMCTRGTAVEWTLRSDPSVVRRPKERTTVYRRGSVFWAAGQMYLNAEGLMYRPREKDGWTWFLDRYGRKVFYADERYPCFDSYDYANENRYHRWFFLCEGGKLTRVYTAEDEIRVTEDAAYVEDSCWEKMQQHGYPERR